MSTTQRVRRGVIIAVYRYASEHPQSVRERGLAALRDPSRVPQRSHAGRALAYFAGRAAAIAALHEWGEKAWVEPSRPFGYIQVVNREGRTVPDLHVNISHTQSVAVAAVSSAPIGVDVEAIDRDARRAIRRVTSEHERMHIVGKTFTLDGRTFPAELALWSSKEAVSKAIGLGIKFGMQAFQIGLSAEAGPYEATIGIQGPLALAQPAVELVLEGDFLIAVCTERLNLTDGVRKLSLSGNRE